MASTTAAAARTGMPTSCRSRSSARSCGIKKEYPSWGAPKIRDKLIREYPMITPPAVSTIHAVLDRHGLVKRRKRRRYKAHGTDALRRPRAQRPVVRRLQGRVHARQQAVLLPADHHRLPLPLPARLRRPRVDPVEVRLLRVRAHLQGLRPARRDPHRQRRAVRLRHALFGLSASPSGGCGSGSDCSASSPATRSRTAATSACISRSRTKPPSPPRSTSCSSRSASTTSSRFTTTSGRTRRSAAPIRRSLYTFSPTLRRRRSPSTRIHDRTVRVTRCGRICLGNRKINLSKRLRRPMVGIREVDDQIWLVSFLDYDLGFFDQDEGRVEPAPNPFAPEKVLTMSPE